MSKAAEWTARRAPTAQEQGRPQGPEGSLGKLASSIIARAAARLHTSLLGPDALLSGDDAPMNGLLAEILVSVPATSIAGGTDEIQRNIILDMKQPGVTVQPLRQMNGHASFVGTLTGIRVDLAFIPWSMRRRG